MGLPLNNSMKLGQYYYISNEEILLSSFICAPDLSKFSIDQVHQHKMFLEFMGFSQ